MEARFAHLPTTLLAQILSYSCIGYATIELLKCGNSLLSTKLCNGGAVRVSLVSLDRKNAIRIRLPKLLLALQQLRVLHIKAHKFVLIDMESASSTLKKLFPTLEELCIDARNSIQCLANFDLVLNETHPIEVLTRLSLEKTIIWNIKRTLPRLQRLELVGPNLDFPFRSSFVPYLPTGLNYLSLSSTSKQSWDLKRDTCVLETIIVDELRIPISQLPPSLTVLRTNTTWTTDMVLMLPENVTEVSKWKTTVEDLDSQKLLLPNGSFRPISHMSLEGAAFGRGLSFNTPISALWPPTLTNLCLLEMPPGQWLTVEHIRCIPRTVTDLSLCALLAEFTEVLMNLPLKTLRFYSIGEHDESSLEFLPKTITVFEQISHPYAMAIRCLPPSQFEFLPSALKHLKLGPPDGVEFETGFRPFASFQLFPSNLVSIVLDGYYLTAYWMARLPPTVTKWECKVKKTPALSPQLAARLPRHLTYMHAAGLIIEAQAVQYLPRELEWLGIGGFEVEEDEDEFETLMSAVSALPPGLRTLKADSSDCPLPKQALRILPPKLHSLKLYVTQIVDDQFMLPSRCYAPIPKPYIPKYHINLAKKGESGLSAHESINEAGEAQLVVSDQSEPNSTFAQDYTDDSSLFDSLPPTLTSLSLKCEYPVSLSDATLERLEGVNLTFNTLHITAVFPRGIVFPAYQALNEQEFSLTPVSDLVESEDCWTCYRPYKPK